jgi:uncharacterized protein
VNRKLRWYLVISLIVLTALYLYIQANWLHSVYYRVDPPKTVGHRESIRILHLSDLHSKKFGRNNSRLIGRIQSAAPDLIVMSGDMIDATGDDGTVIGELVRSLAGRYPIFYSIGNHEQLAAENARENGLDVYANYLSSLAENNVVILDNARSEFSLGEARLNLYGFTLPLEYYRGERVKKFLFKTELEEGLLLQSLGAPDPAEINILLAHAPKYFAEYAAWGADLAFSGHVHGGVIRIPGLGGLMAPQQGFFPAYDGGRYTLNGKTMFVSRGKGSHLLNLRVNNRPQITVVDLFRDRP